ncbi:MAG: type II toxin-antitoxin system RelE/ParE family toxin [Sphingobacteriales bacterium]|nr:type II toxin-antitoxin system RelE/ParE family toxin [Sphingobacteriales bacterium]MBI3718422.1 type II toxin-antitoxin system RelE/ParE family toxin [Sphingobacteriales bacterium]
MTLPLELTAEAINDITGIVKWYDEQQSNLGNVFVEHLHLAFTSIASNPSAFQRYHRNVRKTVLKKFPYLVLFREEKEKIIIHAVFHTRRSPETILKRIKK